MSNRLDLQKALESILGSSNVYFQPPSNYAISYPCIVYELSDLKKQYASNIPYSQKERYTVTIIDKNPDSRFISSLSKMAYSSFDRHYIADNLHHYVFTIFY